MTSYLEIAIIPGFIILMGEQWKCLQYMKAAKMPGLKLIIAI